MKILGILASPHNNGGSAQLLCADMKAVLLEECEAEIVSLYAEEIKSCIGCINDGEPDCKYPCIFDDYGKVLLEKIFHCDGIIFATPTYWFSISSPIKSFD
jgi:multimeric flavodoxin WrbA